jgi:ABC-type sugar transport system substrate-binding protein
MYPLAELWRWEGDKMKVIYKFNDGMTIETIEFEGSQIQGAGDFLRLTDEGRKNDSDITVNTIDGQTVTRKYRDLTSIEIVF